MTIREFIKEYRINRYRVISNGSALYDNTLTRYECPPVLADSIVTDVRTTATGLTMIEI